MPLAGLPANPSQLVRAADTEGSVLQDRELQAHCSECPLAE